MKPFVAWTRFRLAGALATGLVAAGGIAGCGAKPEPPKGVPPGVPVAKVRVQNVDGAPQARTEEVAGTVRAKLHATLEAKLSGRIASLPVVLGQQVKAGELLVRLDAAEIVARHEQASAAVEQAGREWKRTAALFENQAATRAEYDAAEARHRVAMGAAAEAKAIMGYVELVAPFDGVVTRKWVDVGDLAAPGKALIEMEDPSVLQLEADVPEAIASHLQRNTRLAIRVDGIAGELTGTVGEIAPGADPVSRTFRVKLDLPRTPGLLSGRFARVLVPVGNHPSLRVPASAVVQRGQLEMVFVVVNQHAQLRLVKTGRRAGDAVEVLSGLDGNDTVVVEGATRLTDGQPVEAK